MSNFEENTEHYNLNGKEDIEDIISKHFPNHASQSRKIKHDCIYDNIERLPSSAIVTIRDKNTIEVILHETDEENFNRISGNFRLRREDDGSLVVSKGGLSDYWEIVDTIKPP